MRRVGLVAWLCVLLSAAGGIAQTAPTITWPTPAAITSGTALSATQLGATASVAGTFAYSPASGTVLAAGLHTLSTTFTPTDTTDYSTVIATVQLAVTSSTSSTGAVGSIPMFIGATSLGNSVITQANSNIGIGNNTPVATLDVNGTIHTASPTSALVLGTMPASLSLEFAVSDQPSLIVNGDTGGSSPNFGGNSLAVYDFRNATEGESAAFPPPSIYLGKSRSGQPGTPGGIVQSGDFLGALSFIGDNGTSFSTMGAYIGGVVDGTPSSTSLPGRLVFATTTAGSTSPSERVRITSAGYVGIGTTNPLSLFAVGSSSQFQVGSTGAVTASSVTASGTVTAATFSGSGSGLTGIPYSAITGAPAAGVTSVTAGTGLSGGTITGSGTIGLNLGNANSWTAAQTFGGGTGIWNASGNVGIGTTSPVVGVGLTVTTNAGNADGSVVLPLTPGIYQNGATTGNALSFLSNSSTANQQAWGQIGLYQQSSNANDQTAGVYLGIRGFYQGVTGELPIGIGQGWAGSGGPSLYVNTTGNVGIGTTNPGASLEVNGNVKLTASSGGSITFQDGTTQSTAYTGVTCGGDYAESVEVTGNRTNFEPGDVLVLDADNPGKILKSSESYSASVSGIYSTKPGTVGRRQTTSKSEDEVPMAVIGIVPAKVSAENGPIKVGDLLVSSSTPGYAMKGTDRSRMLGAVVGKAMAKLDSGAGVIEVLVTLQ